MSPKLSVVPREDACEGAGKGAQVIQLPVTPKLHAIDGGRTDATHESTTDKTPYAPYQRPDIGIGHHKAQRHWEVRDSAREKVVGVLIGESYLEHLDHKVLAASTTVKRPDGVTMTITLTRNAYEKLVGTRLRVPTDIGEHDY